MGFFDEAGINANEIPDDPFGFGNDFWPVRIIEIGDPKVTTNGDKYGMMLKWAIDHPRFQNSYLSEGLGNGNWTQLPVPKVLQEQGVPFDPANDPKHAAVLFNLGNLFTALGFSKDEMGGIGPNEMLGRGCLAKIKASQDDQGFWKFNLRQMKPFKKDSNGVDETGSSAANNSQESADSLLAKELKDA